MQNLTLISNFASVCNFGGQIILTSKFKFSRSVKFCVHRAFETVPKTHVFTIFRPTYFETNVEHELSSFRSFGHIPTSKFLLATSKMSILLLCLLQFLVLNTLIYYQKSKSQLWLLRMRCRYCKDLLYRIIQVTCLWG